MIALKHRQITFHSLTYTGLAKTQRGYRLYRKKISLVVSARVQLIKAIYAPMKLNVCRGLSL